MAAQGKLSHRVHIRSHLRDNGNFYGILHVGSIDGNQFHVLPYIASHSGEPHLRTGEVELNGVHTSFFSHAGQIYPLLLCVAHYGSHHNLAGEVSLQAGENLEINSRRIFRQLLHVSETGKASVRIFHDIKSRRNFLDFLQADCLVKYSSPSCFKSRCHHLVVGADGGRSQEERVLAPQAAELNLQRREFSSSFFATVQKSPFFSAVQKSPFLVTLSLWFITILLSDNL